MSYSWDIPIVMISESTLNLTQLYPTFWMTKSDLFVTIETDIDNNEFVIVNPEEIGN